MIDPKEEIILYGEEENVVEAVKRLLRIGYVNIRGFSNFKIDEWTAKGQIAYQPDWVESVYEQGKAVLDVRKPG